MHEREGPVVACLRVCVEGWIEGSIQNSGGVRGPPRSCNQILKCIDAIHSSSSVGERRNNYFHASLQSWVWWSKLFPLFLVILLCTYSLLFISHSLTHMIIYLSFPPSLSGILALFPSDLRLQGPSSATVSCCSHGFRLIKSRSRVGLSPISVHRGSHGLAPIFICSRNGRPLTIGPVCQ